MSKTSTYSTLSVLLIIFSFTSIQLYGQKTLVEIDDIYPEDVRIEGFVLDSNQDLEIDALRK